MFGGQRAKKRALAVSHRNVEIVGLVLGEALEELLQCSIGIDSCGCVIVDYTGRSLRIRESNTGW